MISTSSQILNNCQFCLRPSNYWHNCLQCYICIECLAIYMREQYTPKRRCKPEEVVYAEGLIDFSGAGYISPQTTGGCCEEFTTG